MAKSKYPEDLDQLKYNKRHAKRVGAKLLRGYGVVVGTERTGLRVLKYRSVGKSFYVCCIREWDPKTGGGRLQPTLFLGATKEECVQRAKSKLPAYFENGKRPGGWDLVVASLLSWGEHCGSPTYSEMLLLGEYTLS
jgi:hypothetical protein